MAGLTDSILEILELNTRLFRNCLAGMDDEGIRHRISDNTNSLHFLGCHLVDARFYISTMIGAEAPSPFPELASVRSIDEMPDPGPALDAIREKWEYISPLLSESILLLVKSDLRADCPISLPTKSPSLLAGLTFFMQHESYHIGQMALLRKAMQFDAMSYE